MAGKRNTAICGFVQEVSYIFFGIMRFKRAVFAVCVASLGSRSQQCRCSTVVAHFSAVLCSADLHVLQRNNKQDLLMWTKYAQMSHTNITNTCVSLGFWMQSTYGFGVASITSREVL